MKELEHDKNVGRNIEPEKLEIDPSILKEIRDLIPEKMKKTKTKKVDLSKYIGILDSDEPISDSVQDHDLL